MAPLSPYEIASQLTELIHESDEAYRAYGEAKSNYENLYEQKKSILGSLVMAPRDGKVSASMAEHEALSSTDYTDYLSGLAIANTEYLRAYARVKGIEVKLACLQSLNKLTTKELETNNSPYGS